jgi:multidrug efflux system outer membrane protein
MRSNPTFRLAALAAAALLAACSSMTPPYQRPEAPVAATWPGDATTEGTAAAADVPWEDFFADPQLRGLIALALRGNRDLRVAVLSIEQAQAQYQIRNADRLPTVGVQAGASRTPTGNGNANTLYSAAVGISSWEIDFFGRSASLSDAAL